jgi:hypothetical protein
MLTRDQQLHENAVRLHDKARKCRELAGTAMTEEGRSVLFEIAQRYEEEASTADRPGSSRNLPAAPA